MRGGARIRWSAWLLVLAAAAAALPAAARPNAEPVSPAALLGIQAMAAAAGPWPGSVTAATVRAESAEALEAVLRDHGLRSETTSEELAAARVRLAGEGAALVAALRADPRVRFVEPDRPRRAAHRRDDPLTYRLDPATGRPYQWTFRHVRLDRALNLAAGDPSILVGVVDSGVAEVPDLAGKVVGRFGEDGQPAAAGDPSGHGTFVASLIAAVNDDGYGLAGACGACRIVAVQDAEWSSFGVAAAIRRLTDAGVRVINMSFGGPEASQLEAEAVAYAIGRNVLLVASSGNEASGAVSYPAALLQEPNGAPGWGLAVGSSDASNQRSSFSNWGERLSLLAPGSFSSSCQTGVLSALPPVASDFDSGCGIEYTDGAGGRYAYAIGTSFSAPQVAGAAALLWSAKPELRNHEVARILTETATRDSTGWQPELGWGVLDAARALERATGRSSADRVVLGRLSTSGAPRATKAITYGAATAWQDGRPVVGARVACTATLGAHTLRPRGTFARGRARCSLRVPARSAGRRLVARLTVTDEDGNRATRSFRATVRPVRG